MWDSIGINYIVAQVWAVDWYFLCCGCEYEYGIYVTTFRPLSLLQFYKSNRGHKLYILHIIEDIFHTYSHWVVICKPASVMCG